MASACLAPRAAAGLHSCSGPAAVPSLRRPGVGPTGSVGATLCPARAHQQERRAQHCGPIGYGTGRRIMEVDERDTKEYKIARIAEIFGCTSDVVHRMVKIRPGLLLVPSMDFYRHKLASVAARNHVSHHQASTMILNNPALLFEP